MKKLPVLSIVLFYSSLLNATDLLEYKGSFDNVNSTETGHCYGTSVSIWKNEQQKIIGLLDVHSGLCGDPPCSIIEGEVFAGEISFKTNKPIYNKLYIFKGKISKHELSGKLNSTTTKLKSSQFQLSSKHKNEWCETWSKVTRCSGVKEYCE